MEKITLYVTPLKNILIFFWSYPIHSAVLFFSEPSLLFICVSHDTPMRKTRKGKKKKQLSPIDGKHQLNESLMCRGDGRSEGL